MDLIDIDSPTGGGQQKELYATATKVNEGDDID